MSKIFMRKDAHTFQETPPDKAETITSIHQFERGKSAAYKSFLCVIVCVAAMIVGMKFVAAPAVVSGSSMEPTLHDGDLIVYQIFRYTPEYGDIILCKAHGETLIKRIIGMPGDRIRIDPIEGIVYRNGSALDEPYTLELTHLMEDMNGEVFVEENHLFVMGDNRNDSLDSRDASVGQITYEAVKGGYLFRWSRQDT